jgi:hypothetical protein
MNVLYGKGFSADRLDLTLLGAAVGCYLAAAALSQALLALDHGRRAAAAWALAATLFIALYAVLPGAQLSRIAIALVLALATGLAGLSVALAHSLRHR